MIVETIKYPNHYQNNLQFNRSIQSLIESIFHTKNWGEIGYLLSTEENFLLSRHNYQKENRTSHDYHRPQSTVHYKNYKKYEGLGPLEYALSIYLLNCRYNVILLTGALGSGKSSLSNYVLDFLDKNEFDTDGLIGPRTVIGIDFNEISTNQKKEEIIEEFNQQLMDQLAAGLLMIERKKPFVLDFIKKLKDCLTGDNIPPREACFLPYIRKIIRDDNGLVTELDYINDLLDWITTNEDNAKSYRLRLLVYVLDYVNVNHFDQIKRDFIIFFDNIDSLPDDAQLDVLDRIFSFSDKVSVTFLVPMRLTSFGKIHGNGSYNFGVFQNTGHSPISIIAERVSHYLLNKERYKERNSLEPAQLALFDAKMINVFNEFKDPNSRLKKNLESLAGNSVRRGLNLAIRLLINSSIHYESINPSSDLLTHSLLVGDNVLNKIKEIDDFVMNVFTKNGGENSLLKIRMLYILDRFRNSRAECTVGLLMSQLQSLTGYYDSQTILEGINELIFSKRRLAYIDGVRKYNNVITIFQSTTDKIQITYAGVLYLEHLLYDLQYLQTCFASLDWSVAEPLANKGYIQPYLTSLNISIGSNNTVAKYLSNLFDIKKPTITDLIPKSIDYDSEMERMALVRQGLSLFLINDINQLSYYYDYDMAEASELSNKFIDDSIVIRIICKVSINVLRILSGNRTSTREEIYNWFNLLLIVENWEKVLYPTKFRLSANSIKEYDNVLRSVELN